MNIIFLAKCYSEIEMMYENKQFKYSNSRGPVMLDTSQSISNLCKMLVFQISREREKERERERREREREDRWRAMSDRGGRERARV